MSDYGLVGATLFRAPERPRPRPKPKPKKKRPAPGVTPQQPSTGRLWVGIAYDHKKDLGRAYDAEMRRIGEDDWLCLLDHDAMWTTRSWYTQLEAAIRAHPAAGAFTAVTNRIGCRWQRAPGADPNNHDMLYHRQLGAELAERHGSSTRDATEARPLLSGVVIVISKAAWRQIGGFASGFLGVDNRLHADLRRVGRRVYLLPGLYVYHWYRARGDSKHLAGVKTARQS